jgi:hypothetical protein
MDFATPIVKTVRETMRADGRTVMELSKKSGIGLLRTYAWLMGWPVGLTSFQTDRLLDALDLRILQVLNAPNDD